MTRFSIFGYYGQGNAGDEAILSALIDGIKSELPKAHISVCSANPDETKRNHGVNAFRFFGIDLKSIIKGVIGRSRRGYINAVISFIRSDVIVIGGGGLFYDTKETNEWFFGYINLIHRAKRFGKKVALVGISVGPLHHKSSEQATKDAFALVDLISVRDNTSRDTLIRCGVPAEKIHVIPDLVFTLSPASDGRVNDILRNEQFTFDGKKNIALTPCCYNNKKNGWLTQYGEFCKVAIETLNANIWFIPMQRSSAHDDLSAIDEIIALLPNEVRSRIFTLKGIYSAREVQGIIGKADFALAERLHGSIMAINGKVPVRSIAYMPKVTGVLELAQLNESLINMEHFLDGSAHESLINAAKDLMLTTPNFSQNFHCTIRLAKSNFEKLAALKEI